MKPVQLFKAPAATVFGSGGGEEDEGEGGAGNPEEFEPQVDFKPIVKLHEVEVKTGEEDEEVLFKQRCKLFRFHKDTKEWKEKGVGDMKILKHKKTGAIRILMRRDQVLKLCANHRILPGMSLKEVTSKQLQWVATDFSDNNEAKTEILLVKFKTDEEAIKFRAEFNKSVDEATKMEAKQATPVSDAPKPVVTNKLTEMFKSNDNWNCTGCYASNKKESVKCACCSTARPGAAETKVTPATPAFSFGASHTSTPSVTQPIKPNEASKSNMFSFGQANQTQPAQNKPIFSFGSLTKAAEAPKTVTNPPVNNTTAPPTTTTPQSNSLFAKASLPSFSSLASSAENATVKPFAGFGLQPSTVKPLFAGFGTSNTTTTNTTTPSAAGDEGGDEAGGENPEEFEPEVEFKPVVKLKEVDVKTGEEEEEVVFKQRCKLFRFDSDNKEWKEKGVGEMKVLKHKVTLKILDFSEI